jgi:hypothetical protein
VTRNKVGANNVYIRAIRNSIHLLVQVVGCCILMAF